MRTRSRGCCLKKWIRNRELALHLEVWLCRRRRSAPSPTKPGSTPVSHDGLRKSGRPDLRRGATREARAESVGVRGYGLSISKNPSPEDFATLVSDLSREGRGEEDFEVPSLPNYFRARNAPHTFGSFDNQLKSQQMRPPSERTMTQDHPGNAGPARRRAGATGRWRALTLVRGGHPPDMPTFPLLRCHVTGVSGIRRTGWGLRFDREASRSCPCHAVTLAPDG